MVSENTFCIFFKKISGSDVVLLESYIDDEVECCAKNEGKELKLVGITTMASDATEDKMFISTHLACTNVIFSC